MHDDLGIPMRFWCFYKVLLIRDCTLIATLLLCKHEWENEADTLSPCPTKSGYIVLLTSQK